MDKEKFIDALTSQYRSEIEEILVESEHVYRSTIDYEVLDQKVEQLFKCARVDGLEDKIVWDLLQARIPSYVNYKNYKMSHKSTSKKAA